MPPLASLTGKLVLWILLALLVVQVPLALYDQRESRAIVEGLARERTKLLLEQVRTEIEGELRSVEDAARTLAALLQNQRTDLSRSELALRREAIERALRSFVRTHRLVYGSTVAFEPYAFDPELRDFAPYFYGAFATYADLASERYRYREQPWYRLAAQTGAALWSEPYFDEGGGDILMATYSVPLFMERGGVSQFSGVVTADLALAALAIKVDEAAARIGNSGYGLVLSGTGRFLAAPEQDWIRQGLSAEQVAADSGPEQLGALSGRIDRDEQGQLDVESLITGKPGILAFAPLGETGWTVALGVDRAELVGEIERLNRLQWTVLVLGVGLMVVVVVLVARSITRPLRHLAQATREVAAGDLDAPLPQTRSRDEVGRLARAFAAMRESLKTHIAELVQTTAAKQKLESELEIAKEIQMAMLPGARSAAEAPDSLLIAARLVPAKAVGGDLYDYFLLGDGRLCLLVGDVSDKGVPAALHMARTITLIKGVVGRGDLRIDEALAAVNEELSRDNPACMFVTLFLAVLDPDEGGLEWASAGHNPPLILGGDGVLEWLSGDGGSPLGLFAGSSYPLHSTRIPSGGSMILYTDGITEAFDAQGRQFGEQRLFDTLAAAGAQAPDVLAKQVMRALSEFTGEAAQSDDLTLLIVARAGPKARGQHRERKPERIVVESGGEELSRLRAFVEDACVRRRVPAAVGHELQLIAEEVLTNIVRHGFGGSLRSPIEVELSDGPGALVLEFRDGAPAFNPLELADPELERSSEQAAGGGVGVFLVKRLSDEIAYRRQDGLNILTITKRLPVSDDPAMI